MEMSFANQADSAVDLNPPRYGKMNIQLVNQKICNFKQ
jgi:hypothetical protein